MASGNRSEEAAPRRRYMPPPAPFNNMTGTTITRPRRPIGDNDWPKLSAAAMLAKDIRIFRTWDQSSRIYIRRIGGGRSK